MLMLKHADIAEEQNVSGFRERRIFGHRQMDIVESSSFHEKGIFVF